MDELDGDEPQRARPSRFGTLLLAHRRAAGLTQEDLARAAGTSVRALSNLERGRARAAQRRSADALADALGLVGPQRLEFLNAARHARLRSTNGRPADAGVPLRALAVPPAVVADFVGREEELAQLRSWAAEAADVPSGLVVSITGPPGIGKTALAVAAVHELAGRFRNGSLALDLRGMDAHPLTPSEALDRLLRSLGADSTELPRSEPELSSLFRSLLAGRRLVVLLDDAADEAHVRPLLATSAGCLTVVTSRQTLSGLEGARWLALGPLATAQAVDLVTAIVGSTRVEAEPDATRELVGLCGNLPLAVRIAGNRLARQSQWLIAGLAAHLRDERNRLTTLVAGDLRVRSAYALSYQRLTAETRLMFRRLALVPGTDFGPEVAALAADVDSHGAQEQLDRLVACNLIRTGTKSVRYQFDDLIRIFSRERLEAEESGAERSRTADAVHSHLLATATRAGRLFDPGGPDSTPDAIEWAPLWLDRESSNWAAIAGTATGRHRDIADFATSMRWYAMAHRQHPWTGIFTHGLNAARTFESRHTEVVLLNCVGWAQRVCDDDPDSALSTTRQALAAALEIGDKYEQAWALVHLASLAVDDGRLDDASTHNHAAGTLFEPTGDWAALMSVRHNESRILLRLGRHDQALTVLHAVSTALDRPDGTPAPALLDHFRSHTVSLMDEVVLSRDGSTHGPGPQLCRSTKQR